MLIMLTGHPLITPATVIPPHSQSDPPSASHAASPAWLRYHRDATSREFAPLGGCSIPPR